MSAPASPQGRLIVLCAAGLDWLGFEAAVASGQAPNFARLAAAGARGPLSGADFPRGPAAWTTLATGRPPEDHGVWRPEEPWGGRIRPAGRSAWRAAAVWETLEAAGVATGVVGWPAAHPAGAWPGRHIDASFAEPTGRTADDWALPPRAVPPPDRETLRGLRVHPTEVTAAMLRPLVPGLDAIDQSRDTGLPRLAVAMARAASVHAAAIWMLTKTPARLVMLRQPWLGEVRTAFAPATDGAFAQVLPAAVAFLDGLAGRLMALMTGADRLVLVSPGWDGAPGVWVASGAGIAPHPAPAGGQLIDLAPSILAHFALADPSLPGRALPGLTTPAPLRPAPRVAPPAPVAPDPAIVQALEAADLPTPRAPPAAQAAARAAELAAAIVARAPDLALALADEALAASPASLPALRAAALAAFALGQAERLPALADRLAELAPDRAWAALARAAAHRLADDRSAAAAALRAAPADPDPQTRLSLAAAWLEIARPTEAARAYRTLLADDPANPDPRAEAGLALCAMAERDFRAAEDRLTALIRRRPDFATAHTDLAALYRQTGRRPEAALAAARAEALNGGRPLAPQAPPM